MVISLVLNMLLLFAYAASRSSVASIIVYCFICLSSETSFASSNSLHWPLQVDKNVGTQHSYSSSNKLKSMTSKAESSGLHYSPDYYRHQLDYEEGSIDELDKQLHWKNVPQPTDIIAASEPYWGPSISKDKKIKNHHQINYGLISPLKSHSKINNQRLPDNNQLMDRVSYWKDLARWFKVKKKKKMGYGNGMTTYGEHHPGTEYNNNPPHQYQSNNEGNIYYGLFAPFFTSLIPLALVLGAAASFSLVSVISNTNSAVATAQQSQSQSQQNTNTNSNTNNNNNNSTVIIDIIVGLLNSSCFCCTKTTTAAPPPPPIPATLVRNDRPRLKRKSKVFSTRRYKKRKAITTA